MKTTEAWEITRRIVRDVWVAQRRIATPGDIAFIHSLDSVNQHRSALEGALDYLGVLSEWNEAGRPTFGKFRDWWRCKADRKVTGEEGFQ